MQDKPTTQETIKQRNKSKRNCCPDLSLVLQEHNWKKTKMIFFCRKNSFLKTETGKDVEKYQFMKPPNWKFSMWSQVL